MLSLVYILGWLGTAIYLVNYAHLSLAVKVDHKLYFSANALAAGLLMAGSLALSSWQPVAINGFWLAVSILALRGRGIRMLLVSKIGLRGVVATLLLCSIVVWFEQQGVAIAILGWTSALAFCGSYLLFSACQLDVDEFHLFNGFAAIALLPVLWLDKNWPIFALEVCWFTLAVTALVRHTKGGLGLPAELETGARQTGTSDSPRSTDSR